MVVVEVPIGTRGKVIHVETHGDAVRIANPRAWDVRLTREEAWRLAEPIEHVATGGT